MVVTIDYAPRNEIVDAFHDRVEPNCCWIAHRRFGKTVGIANDGIKRLVKIPIEGRKHAPPKIAWMYPSRVRAKDIAWSYLKYYSKDIPGVRHLESELAVEFSDGRRFTLYGADGHRGVGQYLDGIYYDERDDIPDSVIVDLAPTLLDYKGFEVHAGMLRGRHKLWKMRQQTLNNPKWLNLLVRASESGVIGAEELQSLRAPTSMGESAYQLQMECNPNASLAHAIYGAQMDAARAEKRICRLPWDPFVPLDWFADIGHSLRGDNWAWWGIQMVGREILAQSYFSNTNKIPAWYAQEIRNRTEAAGVPLGTIYLPHDGDRLDRHGNSAKDDLMAAGLARVEVISRTPNVWNSINDVRGVFPGVWIDESRCDVETHVGTLADGTAWILPSGISCLELYTKKERTDGIPGEEPAHNVYSHGADAFRTFIEAFKHGKLKGTSDLATESRLPNVVITRAPQSNGNTYSWPQRRVTITR